MKYVHSLRRPVGVALSLSLALGLTACATQDDIQPTLSRVQAGHVGLQEPADSSTPFVLAEVPAWWRSLGDAQLDALVERALNDNPSLQTAAARVRQAQSGVVLAGAATSPAVQLKGQVDRQHFPEQGLYPAPIAGASATMGTLELEGSWEWDLFGKHRAELDAAVGQTRAAQADAQASRWWLSTQVVRTYVQLGRLQAQVAVAQRTLAQRDEVFRLVRQRVEQGLDSRIELKQSESGLPDTRTQIEALQEQVMLTRHALAVMTGQGPTALDGLVVRLEGMTLPKTPAQMPLALLSHRPDLMAALWRAQAAQKSAQATRIALFYPNIDLVGYAGYNAIGLGNVLKPGNAQWGLMPAITLPLFDGDRRRAHMQSEVSQEDLAIATYNQVVQQAAQDAVDQLGSVQSVTRQQQTQREAQASAEAAYESARARYEAGLTGYLNVLSAETAVLAQRRAAVDLQGRALDARIGLIRALAGAQSQAEPGVQPPSTSNARSSLTEVSS